MDVTINQRIRDLLKLLGKTQVDVANELGVKRQQVNQWCVDGNSVGKKTIDKLLEQYKQYIGPEYFYETSEINEPTTEYKTKVMNEEMLLLLSSDYRDLKKRVERIEERLNEIEEPLKKKEPCRVVMLKEYPQKKIKVNG